MLLQDHYEGVQKFDVQVNVERLYPPDYSTAQEERWIAYLSFTQTPGHRLSLCAGEVKQDVQAQAASMLSQLGTALYVQAFGAAALQECIDRAQELSSDDIQLASDAVNQATFSTEGEDSMRLNLNDVSEVERRRPPRPRGIYLYEWGNPHKEQLTAQEAFELEDGVLQWGWRLPFLHEAQQKVTQEKERPSMALPYPPIFWCVVIDDEQDMALTPIDMLTGEPLWREEPDSQTWSEMKAHVVFVREAK